MNILGIDYGMAKTGVAIARGFLIEPYIVIRSESEDHVVSKITEIIKKEEINKVIVGVSEGETAKKTLEFITNLRAQVGIPVDAFDETLTTQDAQKLAKEIGAGRSKTKKMEDSYAAAVMLTNWLSTRPEI